MKFRNANAAAWGLAGLAAAALICGWAFVRSVQASARKIQNVNIVWRLARHPEQLPSGMQHRLLQCTGSADAHATLRYQCLMEQADLPAFLQGIREPE